MQWFERGELFRKPFGASLLRLYVRQLLAGRWSRRWLRGLSLGLALARPLVLAIVLSSTLLQY